MVFRRIASPEDLTILKMALEEYCRAVCIQPGTPAHEDAGRYIIAMFNAGRLSADEIDKPSMPKRECPVEFP